VIRPCVNRRRANRGGGEVTVGEEIIVMQ
jgi:hypothetical protein